MVELKATLKPCPLCGRTAFYCFDKVLFEEYNEPAFTVGCDKCGLTLTRENLDGAVRCWNARCNT